MNTRKHLITGHSSPGLDAQIEKAMASGANKGFLFEGTERDGKKMIRLTSIQPVYTGDVEDFEMLMKALQSVIDWAKSP